MKRYFLGKLGKVFGPFTVADFEKMQRSGEVFNYTFYCSVEDNNQSEWLMFDTTPPQLNLNKADTDSSEWVLIDKSRAFRLEPEFISSVGGSFLIHAQTEKIHAPLKIGQQIRVSSLVEDESQTRDGKIISLQKVGRHWKCDVSWALN